MRIKKGSIGKVDKWSRKRRKRRMKDNGKEELYEK
jgi:hypothetical protein